jgi:cell division protein FtsJ
MTINTANRIKVKVKTAKYRKKSSTRWLQRQLNDPFVKKAHELGYRSRATFKIIEIDDKFHIFKKGKKVVDIGSAPGGWSDIAVKRVGKGNVVAIDILNMKPIDGVHFKQIDFNEDEAKEFLTIALEGKADVVISDIAPNTTGNANVDHLQIMVKRFPSRHIQLFKNMIIRTADKDTRFFNTDVVHQIKVLFLCAYPRRNFRKLITERHTFFYRFPILFCIDEKFTLTN